MPSWGFAKNAGGDEDEDDDDDNDSHTLGYPTPLPALRTQEKARREAQDPHLDNDADDHNGAAVQVPAFEHKILMLAYVTTSVLKCAMCL